MGQSLYFHDGEINCGLYWHDLLVVVPFKLFEGYLRPQVISTKQRLRALHYNNIQYPKHSGITIQSNANERAL